MANQATPLNAGRTKTPAITENRMKESSFMRNSWFISIPSGTEPEALLDPAYWANISTKFRATDIVEAATEDMTWFGRYIVIKADRLWAKLYQLELHDLVGAQADMPLTEDQNHRIEWKGPVSKYTVIRISDSANIKDGFSTQLDAAQWLDSHLKSLAA